jgi:hypothetical protein
MKKPMDRKFTIECLSVEFYKTSSYSKGLRFKVFWVTQCWDVGRNVEEPTRFTNRFPLILIFMKMYIIFCEL